MAIIYLEKALITAQKQAIKSDQISKLLNNIGYIFEVQGNHEEALKYCMKALENRQRAFWKFTS